MSAPMHSLACFFRLGDDLNVLLDEGRSTPDGTAPEDWDAMWNVVDRAIEQAQACIRHGFGVLSTELLAAGLRFEPVTRAQTLVQKWEVSGRVFARHARQPLAYVGLSLGVDEPHLSVWWGYLRARSVRGPRLVERLRSAGVTTATTASGPAWVPATVILSSLVMTTPRTLAECAATATAAAQQIISHRERFLEQ